MWIWQQQNWAEFSYRSDEILPVLEKTVKAVSPLVLLARELEQEKQLQFESQILFEETLATAKIEGELLDRESVRSSIANRLGLGKITQGSKNVSAFVDVLLEAIRFSNTPLTEPQLLQWHAMMFYEKPLLYPMAIGCYRNDMMQVVSGRFGKQTVHFQAPCDNSSCVAKEMQQFFHWLNQPNLPSFYLKAAIAKLYFVTIHPFDDGNGRLSRIIAERCLAQADATQLRLYSISQQIEKNKADYYQLLESCQKGSLDITEWIIWFLQQVTNAANVSQDKLAKVRVATLFWDKYRDVSFNLRQKKLLQRLLETDDFKSGISRGKYKSLAHTTDISAARDLKDLLEKNILIVAGAGRSTRYLLNA
jgi:Fic family protein